MIKIEKNKIKSLIEVETPVLDALQNYMENSPIPLHIPGHAKGDGVLPKFRDLFGENIINIDTTDEFFGLGKLYPAEGPVAKAQELMAELFGSKNSFFLINGSSVGNLALALTVAKENKKIIVERNCHRSVISGITLTGANPVWAIPERLEDWGIWGAVKPEEIERLLTENPDASAVWITNPTYEGVVSDVVRISEICKEHGVMLIVDEAHGCLWRFNEKLPQSALDCGADAVVHSLHKTGGSFSQSSVLHIGHNSRINTEEIETNLSMLQSTSPSYTLIASLDAARAYLASEQGQERIESAIENAEYVRENLKNVAGVECLSENIDPTKIYIKVRKLSGKRLQSILEFEHNIEIEAATDQGILALSNIGNTSQELSQFCEALKSIVENNYSDITYLENTKSMPFHVPQIVCSPRAAYVAEKEKVSPEEGVGRVSAEVIAVCPPGIPVLVPGEMITKNHLPYLNHRNSILVMKN